MANDENIVCPWRIKETKTVRPEDGFDRIEETRQEFEICHGSKCPFYGHMNPGAGYPNECSRKYAMRGERE